MRHSVDLRRIIVLDGPNTSSFPGGKLDGVLRVGCLHALARRKITLTVRRSLGVSRKLLRSVGGDGREEHEDT